MNRLFAYLFCCSLAFSQQTPNQSPSLMSQVPMDVHKAHSKLFSPRGPNLEGLATQTSGGELTIDWTVTPGLAFLSPGPHPPMTTDQLASNLICGTDAVVLGSLVEESSSLTENKRGVFTEYFLKVDKVIRDNSSATRANPPIPGGNLLFVMNNGDSFIMNGRRMHITYKAAPHSAPIPSKALQVGTPVVVFLRAVPATGHYQATDILQVSGKEVLTRDIRGTYTGETFGANLDLETFEPLIGGAHCCKPEAKR